jgi:hypothetical protein
MTWAINEVVRAGNATAKVKSYFPETGLIVLYDIEGDIDVGSTIIGDDSGTVLTLSQFEISNEYDNTQYDPTNWDEVLDIYIYDGNGEIIATEEYFTGFESQDYQTTNLVVKDQ